MSYLTKKRNYVEPSSRQLWDMCEPVNVAEELKEALRTLARFTRFYGQNPTHLELVRSLARFKKMVEDAKARVPSDDIKRIQAEVDAEFLQPALTR